MTATHTFIAPGRLSALTQECATPGRCRHTAAMAMDALNHPSLPEADWHLVDSGTPAIEGAIASGRLVDFVRIASCLGNVATASTRTPVGRTTTGTTLLGEVAIRFTVTEPAPVPSRIQRRRTRGWRLPDGAVVVTRPTRWANPYPVAVHGRTESLRLFRAYLSTRPDLLAAARTDLAGRDLACWCAPDQPCHADIWLALANKEA